MDPDKKKQQKKQILDQHCMFWTSGLKLLSQFDNTCICMKSNARWKGPCETYGTDVLTDALNTI